MFLTFSGLDGAGKTTIIGETRSNLEHEGVKVTVLTMYDHVGTYAMLRQTRDWVRRRFHTARRRVTAGPLGVGTTASIDSQAGGPRLLRHFVSHVRARQVVYLIDLVLFLAVRAYVEGIRGRLLVLDRYFYDSLVDIAGDDTWTYIRVFLKVVPRPAAAFFIDVNPAIAFARKREHSLEYLSLRQAAYERLFTSVGETVRLRNADLEETIRSVTRVIRGTIRTDS